MTFGDLNASTSSTSSVPGSPSSRSLKIVWQEEIRRLPFNAASTDLQALKELCASCFGIKNLTGLVFTYEDAEGDTVTLSTIEELRGIVEASPATIKLNLNRKPNKAKPAQQPKEAAPQQPKEVPQPIAIEVTQTSTPQPEKPAEKKMKNLRKERKQQLKKEIVHSKVVRIRWRIAAPETSTTEAPVKKDKGCYVSVSLKGKVKFGACGQAQSGLWLMHELSNGEFIFSPLGSSNCCVRVFQDGRINLTEGGAGPRARWSLIKAADQSPVSLSTLGASEKVQIASRFVPGMNLAVVQEFNRKNKPALHPKGVNATTTSIVLTTEFTLEVQDPMTSLIKFAKHVAAKKKAIKNVLKRKEEIDQEAFVEKKNEKLNKNKNKDNKNENKPNKNKNRDPNWASMTKQQRLEAKAARKLERLEQKRLKMALKKKM